MTDALPQDTPELETARGFDSARLIAQVREGNDAAIGEAYRLTFGTNLGRVVLLHALASIGEIGLPRGAETLAEASHKNGRAFAVLKIAGLAGFDPVAIAAAGMTQILEGANHEHEYGPRSTSGPDVTFDEPFTGGAGSGDPDGAVFTDWRPD